LAERKEPGPRTDEWARERTSAEREEEEEEEEEEDEATAGGLGPVEG